MLHATVIFGSLLLMMGGAHIAFGIAFSQFLSRQAKKLERDSNDVSGHYPPTTVVLSLRGADPFLNRTLKALATQDYPNYSVKIVVDHREDPAWSMCQAAIEELATDRIQIEELEHRHETCSLKCSALIQAVQTIGSESTVLVLTDADVVPHKTWLKEIVQPLEDESIGISTGNQWFIPAKPTFGSLVRAVWNAGAIVPTSILGHPWAGSCALRMDDIRRSKLIERWQTSIVDDGPIGPSLTSLGLKVQFVPSVMMVNQEQCEVSFCWTYIRRMLTWSRLFESTYPLTVLHAVTMQGICLIGLILGVAAGWQGAWAESMFGFVGLISFWAANLFAYRWIDRSVRRLTHANMIRESRFGVWELCKAAMAIPMTHLIYVVSAVRACFVRQICWRDITYRIDRSGNVKMLSYAPYRPFKDDSQAELSI